MVGVGDLFVVRNDADLEGRDLALADWRPCAWTSGDPLDRLRERPAFVGVVIPANDEQASIAAAVAAVRRAASHPALSGVELRIVVVDDSSSDATPDHAAGALGESGVVIRVAARSAGEARRAGFAELCRASEGLDGERVWLATTDADSCVFPDWLARQAGWWKRGCDGVAGLVRPFGWEQHPPMVRRRFEAYMTRHGRGWGHPHVYGANLGLTKATYLAAGGMSALETGEDHALWETLHQSGRRVLHASDVLVATSARREGRAPNGFAALLCSLEDQE